jgi:hypothetical protein
MLSFPKEECARSSSRRVRTDTGRLQRTSLMEAVKSEQYHCANFSRRRDTICACGQAFPNGKAYKTHLDIRCALQQGVQRLSVIATAPPGSGSPAESAQLADSTSHSDTSCR